MPAADFWDGDPWLVSGYRAAYDIKRQRKSEEMWLQGLYFYDALSVVVSNMNSKPWKRQNYMEEPIRLTPLREEEKELKAEKEREKLIAYLNNLARQAGEEGITDGRQ